MRVFLTGATGYIGSAVAEALQAAGVTVLGLARTATAEQELKAAGVTPVAGDLGAPDSMASPVAEADAVVHCGTTNNGRRDLDAVQAMVNAAKGTGKKVVYTSGCWVYGNMGETAATEDTPLNPVTLVAWRPTVERVVLDAVSEGVQGVVIRPAIVYGRGQGLPGLFVQTANQTGAARYIGEGNNRWPLVHVEDLADLYVRVLEHAPAGSVWNAAEGESLRTRDIAEAASFGAGLAGATGSWPVAEASEALGAGLVEALLLDQTVSAEKAKNSLGWHPRGLSLLEDLRYGSYAMQHVNP